MKNGINRRAFHICGLWLVGLGMAWGQVPGWSISGTAPQEYSYSPADGVSASGKSGARISAKESAKPGGFGALAQTMSAEPYRGGRWRLSGYLKSDQIAGAAQMWLRIDGPGRKALEFDNLESRHVTGTTGWTRYEIVLDVPKEAQTVEIGFYLAGKGTVWGDGFKLDKVDAATPVSSKGGMQRAPRNLGFE